MSKFADGTKLGGARQIRELSNCQLKLNKSKCQILQLGRGNPGYRYRLGNETLVLLLCLSPQK